MLILTNSALGELRQEDCEFTGNLSPGERRKVGERKSVTLSPHAPCTPEGDIVTTWKESCKVAEN